MLLINFTTAIIGNAMGSTMWDKIKQVIGVQFQCDIFASNNRKGPYFISAVIVEIISRN